MARIGANNRGLFDGGTGGSEENVGGVIQNICTPVSAPSSPVGFIEYLNAQHI